MDNNLNFMPKILSSLHVLCIIILYLGTHFETYIIIIIILHWIYMTGRALYDRCDI